MWHEAINLQSSASQWPLKEIKAKERHAYECLFSGIRRNLVSRKNVECRNPMGNEMKRIDTRSLRGAWCVSRSLQFHLLRNDFTILAYIKIRFWPCNLKPVRMLATTISLPLLEGLHLVGRQALHPLVRYFVCPMLPSSDEPPCWPLCKVSYCTSWPYICFHIWQEHIHLWIQCLLRQSGQGLSKPYQSRSKNQGKHIMSGSFDSQCLWRWVVPARVFLVVTWWRGWTGLGSSKDKVCFTDVF